MKGIWCYYVRTPSETKHYSLDVFYSSVAGSLEDELAVEMPESPKTEDHLITVIETELQTQPHDTLEVVVAEESIAESPVKKVRKEEIGKKFLKAVNGYMNIMLKLVKF